MQELIKIEKKVIGASETNAVSARELHETLEIKKDFSDWIKMQIDRAGLRKDVDYIVVSVKSDGVRPLKEYIITTDSSKHIAMMSQGQKAKEVRDYFIAVEKEYMSEQVLLSDAQTKLIASLEVQNIESKALIGSIVDEQQAQRKGLEIVIKMLHESENRAIQLHNAKIDGYKKTITADQTDKLSAEIARAARSVAQLQHISTSQAKRILFATLNTAMGSKSYHHIPAHKFNEAMAFVRVAGNESEAKLYNISKALEDELYTHDDEDDSFFDEPMGEE